ncbi:MAG: hypothetical protein CMM93_00865 [Rickettsiales bacterium]|nr:hypothetical protein [Rickettsiales bacterium]|tara:strand:- start:71 stop:379 length:309 start_codon:yes stop_codon:yes gene_type:complete
MTHYPESPGYKGDETGRTAAEIVKPKAAAIRERVEAKMKLAGWMGMTAEECQRALGCDVSLNSVRSRLSELHAAGKLIKLDETRMAASGLMVRVYVHKIHMN